jgi:hypothetical protein
MVAISFIYNLHTLPNKGLAIFDKVLREAGV